VSEEKSYYETNKEARRAYQREYYTRNKEALKRKKELQAELEPDKLKEIRKYQREYYLKNRQTLQRKRRERYLRLANE
jgi:hypothetical protein